MISDAAEKAQIVARLERVQALMGELEKATTDAERQALRTRINREVHDPI